MLNTERPHPLHAELDLYNTQQLLSALVEDHHHAVEAVRRALPALEQAVEAAWPRLRDGGRLLYVGAGSSGRLAVLDSVELPPTFSWPPERACAVLAGGPGAMFQAVEGAEDQPSRGSADIAALQPGPADVVLALAASGSTPYVLGALQQARQAGALSIGFANNPDAPVLRGADIAVLLDTGPEVISGSTRLKAGTAQKIALNSFSSAVMVRLGKVYGNLMVDLKASNTKLLQRTLALTLRASGASEAQALQALEACGFRVKTAIVMLRLGCSASQAELRLQACQGQVRLALAHDGAAPS
ncbi:N-acetylmuramic acid 6-phosphate etherase [Roseateles sp. BYS180W]|uniref:N-acetylmuramic acid 6-phosphate etherase n=1 Tax=Roseateles rivi TaxID=3299028 RepID=A0ABW7FVI1_9BURK